MNTMKNGILEILDITRNIVMTGGIVSRGERMGEGAGTGTMTGSGGRREEDYQTVTMTSDRIGIRTVRGAIATTSDDTTTIAIESNGHNRESVHAVETGADVRILDLSRAHDPRRLSLTHTTSLQHADTGYVHRKDLCEIGISRQF